MADEALARSGLYFDELNKIRVFEPEAAQQTQALKENCQEFLERIGEFQRITDNLVTVVNRLQKQVEREKMAAIGARNLVKSVTKQKEGQHQQLQALITEKKLELERLRVQYDSLAQCEAEQQEFIEQFLLQQ